MVVSCVLGRAGGGPSPGERSRSALLDIEPPCHLPVFESHSCCEVTDPDASRILCFGDSSTYGTCLADSDTYGTPPRTRTTSACTPIADGPAYSNGSSAT